MLANTQFVENRVYDEDVSQENAEKDENKQEDKEKTREQREAELIPKVKEALQFGVSVIDEAFETLDSNVANSESEEEKEKEKKAEISQSESSDSESSGDLFGGD